MKELIIKDLKKGEEILKILNKIGVPVFTTIGNLDYARVYDTFDLEDTAWQIGNLWNWEDQDFFNPIVKKYQPLTLKKLYFIFLMQIPL